MWKYESHVRCRSGEKNSICLCLLLISLCSHSTSFYVVTRAHSACTHVNKNENIYLVKIINEFFSKGIFILFSILINKIEFSLRIHLILSAERTKIGITSCRRRSSCKERWQARRSNEWCSEVSTPPPHPLLAENIAQPPRQTAPKTHLDSDVIVMENNLHCSHSNL